MSDITYIIHCWLNVEGMLGVSKQPFMQKVRTEGWTKRRLEIFNRFTLPSLLNQDFKDFRIFLFCGHTYRKITDAFEFDDPENRVERIYDYGKYNYLEEIETPYVNLTRIDSDDMFHFNLMNIVKANVKMTNKREHFVFRNLLQWNRVHNFVSDIRIPRSPFTSHTFTRAIYKNWERFKKEQFLDYFDGRNEGPNKKVCIIRHKRNVTWPRIGRYPTSPGFLETEKRKRKFFTMDRKKMVKLLEPFGVRPELVK